MDRSPQLLLGCCLLALPLVGHPGPLAACGDHGLGTDLGVPRAKAQAGDAAAQFELGDRCYFGRSVPRNHAESARWYQLAAEQGHAGAQVNLGNAYLRGEGLTRNPAEGYVWSALAAEQGQAGAAANRDLAAKKLTPLELREAQGRVRRLAGELRRRKGLPG